MSALKQKSERTRAQLILAAREAFATQGYADVSMQELTESLGLTKGAFYHHFPSKDTLLRAVLTQIEDEISDRIIEVRAEDRDPKDAAVHGALEYFRLITDPSFSRVLLIDGPGVAEWDRVQYDVDNPDRESPVEYLVRSHLAASTSETDVATKMYMVYGGMAELGRWVMHDRDARLDSALTSLEEWLRRLAG